MTIYNTIVACNQIFGIGHQGKIPWRVPADLSYFNMRTMGHAVLMGRVTYESIGFLLPGRHNIIISSKLTAEDIKTNQEKLSNEKKTESTVNYKNIYDVHHTYEQKTTFAIYNSIIDCIIDIEGKYKEVFVIGGQKIYEYFIFNNLVHFEFITLIPYFGPIDTFYPSRDIIIRYKDDKGDIELLNDSENEFTIIDHIKIPYYKYLGSKKDFEEYAVIMDETPENISSNKKFKRLIHEVNDRSGNKSGDRVISINQIIRKFNNSEENNFLGEVKNVHKKFTNSTRNEEKNELFYYKNKYRCDDKNGNHCSWYICGMPPAITANRTAAQAAHEIGVRLEFSLRGNQFPLLTTRKLFLRGIFEELMFYLRGQTDSKILEGLGVNVWRANTTREELDKRGFHEYPVGDMGPTYGFALRHFGAEYIDCTVDYTNCGVDQLADLIKNIIEVKKNPGHASARRLILNMWDATNIDKMVLPPCLYNYQFSVEGDFLSCFATQRSSDVVVAGGWNIAQVALITILIAHVTDLIPNRIIWNVCNMHIYENLKEAAEQQIKREPFIFPKIYIRNKNVPDTDINGAMARLLNFKFEDLILVNYNAHPNIKMEMNV